MLRVGKLTRRRLVAGMTLGVRDHKSLSMTVAMSDPTCSPAEQYRARQHCGKQQ
jgi:hypothetical protein